jgi:hypothetical protein
MGEDVEREVAVCCESADDKQNVNQTSKVKMGCQRLAAKSYKIQRGALL